LAPNLKSIRLIETSSDAETAAQEILTLSENVRVIGFDCEWVGNNKTSLLQISVFDKDSPDGSRSYLFRLCKFGNDKMPLLHELLNSQEVVKLGVGIDGDFKRLISERYVEPGNDSFLDLRFLAAHS